MPNKNYIAGRAFEYELMAEWKSRGYAIIRASGSHGEYDVVAFRPDRPVEFIQAKRVEDEATGKRLLKSFRESTVGNKFFRQTLAVKVKGTKVPLTYTV